MAEHDRNSRPSFSSAGAFSLFMGGRDIATRSVVELLESVASACINISRILHIKHIKCKHIVCILMFCRNAEFKHCSFAATKSAAHRAARSHSHINKFESISIFGATEPMDITLLELYMYVGQTTQNHQPCCAYIWWWHFFFSSFFCKATTFAAVLWCSFMCDALMPFWGRQNDDENKGQGGTGRNWICICTLCLCRY